MSYISVHSDEIIFAFVAYLIISFVIFSSTWAYSILSAEKWHSLFSEEDKQRSERMVLTYIGKWFIGKGELDYEEKDGSISELKYKFFGRSRDDMVMGYFYGQNSKEVGTFLMKNFPDLSEFQGQYMMRSRTEIIPTSYTWRRGK